MGFVDPLGLCRSGPEWHHLIPAAIYRQYADELDRLGININNSDFGWLLNADDHMKLHLVNDRAYVEDWEFLFEEFTTSNGRVTITADDISEHISDIINNPKYRNVLEKGGPALVSYERWSRYGPTQKANLFRTSTKRMGDLRASARLLGRASGAAGRAEALGSFSKLAKRLPIAGAIVAIGSGIASADHPVEIAFDSVSPVSHDEVNATLEYGKLAFDEGYAEFQLGHRRARRNRGAGTDLQDLYNELWSGNGGIPIADDPRD